MIENASRFVARRIRILVLLIAAICLLNSLDELRSETWNSEDSEQEEEALNLTARWGPFGDSLYKFGEEWETLKNLQPTQAEKAYAASELDVFQPPANSAYGEVWRIDVEKVIPILRQLHEGVTPRLHHGGPKGAYGVIAAESESFLRIRTRIHAEFELSDGTYTPSQFAGDIIMDRPAGRIAAFKLFVPPRRNNVDLNWKRVTAKGEVWADADGNIVPTREFSVLADIGFCERIELSGGDWEKANEIQWEREIEFQDADKSFQLQFYEFAQIDWLPFEEAVEESQSTGKPLHVVALFGSLDDESC